MFNPITIYGVLCFSKYLPGLRYSFLHVLVLINLIIQYFKVETIFDREPGNIRGAMNSVMNKPRYLFFGAQ